MKTYTAAQIRGAERLALANTPAGALMKRASWAIADSVCRRLSSPIPGHHVVLLVGGGNNGGDALYAGAILRRRGMAVTAVVTTPSRAHPGGMAALRRRGGRVLVHDDRRVTAALHHAEVIIDGLVGIGARPPLRTASADLVTMANDSSAVRVAVDLPSGLDPDTGLRPGPTFRADVTVTFGGVKTGLVMADDACGVVELATIGMDPPILTPAAGYDCEILGQPRNIVIDKRRPNTAGLAFRQPSATDHKYSSGVVGIAAGSAHYPGAALLTVGGAVRLRPGLVRYAGPQRDIVVTEWPEVVGSETVSATGRVQAWAVGPGMGTDGTALRRLRDVLTADVSVVVDADALTLLAEHRSLLADRARRDCVSVLTPHAGEFARLFPDIDDSDRVTAVRTAARRCGAIVLLKGHRTVIANPAGRTVINTSGSPWLATAGSGDVLTGMIGSLLATGADPVDAAGSAAYLHGVAGERAARDGAAGASALLERIHQPDRGVEV